MQSGYWLVGKWWRIPVSIHWTLLLWLPWYLLQDKNLVWAVLTLLAFTALLCAHEMGHAAIARSRRVKVYAIKLYLLHGQCEHQHPYYEADDVFIAWGGVLAQLVVLILAIAAKHLIIWLAPSTYYLLAPLFSVFINANIVIAAINLIPIAPLDGHKAWRAIPLFRARLSPNFNVLYQKFCNAIDFKKRKAMKLKSKTTATELLNRLTKK